MEDNIIDNREQNFAEEENEEAEGMTAQQKRELAKYLRSCRRHTNNGKISQQAVASHESKPVSLAQYQRMESGKSGTRADTLIKTIHALTALGSKKASVNEAFTIAGFPPPVEPQDNIDALENFREQPLGRRKSDLLVRQELERINRRLDEIIALLEEILRTDNRGT